jgi:hypothetical protein
VSEIDHPFPNQYLLDLQQRGLTGLCAIREEGADRQDDAGAQNKPHSPLLNDL